MRPGVPIHACDVPLQRAESGRPAGQASSGAASPQGSARESATVVTKEPDALRVRSSAVGHRCAYVFIVVVVFACPRARWTVATSHPAAIRPLA